MIAPDGAEGFVVRSAHGALPSMMMDASEPAGGSAFPEIVQLTRLAAGAFAVVSVLGFVMFLGSHDRMTVAYFIVTLVALTVFATYPRRALVSSGFRAVLTLAAIAGLVATVLQMQGDLRMVNGPDWGALFLRTVECGVLVVMAAEAIASGRPRGRWPSLPGRPSA